MLHLYPTQSPPFEEIMSFVLQDNNPQFIIFPKCIAVTDETGAMRMANRWLLDRKMIGRSIWRLFRYVNINSYSRITLLMALREVPCPSGRIDEKNAR